MIFSHKIQADTHSSILILTETVFTSAISGIHETRRVSANKTWYVTKVHVEGPLQKSNLTAWVKATLWESVTRQGHVYHKVIFVAKVQQADVDGLMQDCSDSIANALELLQSWTEPSMWSSTCKISTAFHSICFLIHICFPTCSTADKNFTIHDDVIQWKHFPRYCPFVRGIHRSSHHKATVTRTYLWCFFVVSLNYLNQCRLKSYDLIWCLQWQWVGYFYLVQGWENPRETGTSLETTLVFLPVPLCLICLPSGKKSNSQAQTYPRRWFS